MWAGNKRIRLLIWIFRPFFKRSEAKLIAGVVDMLCVRVFLDFLKMWAGYSASIEFSRRGHCRRNMTFKTGRIKAELQSWNGLWGSRAAVQTESLRRATNQESEANLLSNFTSVLIWRINPSLWSRRLPFAGRAELLTCWIANETLKRCCLNHPDSDKSWKRNCCCCFLQRKHACRSTLTSDLCCRYFSSALVPLLQSQRDKCWREVNLINDSVFYCFGVIFL